MTLSIEYGLSAVAISFFLFTRELPPLHNSLSLSRWQFPTPEPTIPPRVVTTLYICQVISEFLEVLTK